MQSPPTQGLELHGVISEIENNIVMLYVRNLIRLNKMLSNPTVE